MPTLSIHVLAVIVACFGRLRQHTRRHSRALLAGAVLALEACARSVASVRHLLGRPGSDTSWIVIACLAAPHGRPWPRAACRVLPQLLISAFVPAGPVLPEVDETMGENLPSCTPVGGPRPRRRVDPAVLRPPVAGRSDLRGMPPPSRAGNTSANGLTAPSCPPRSSCSTSTRRRRSSPEPSRATRHSRLRSRVVSQGHAELQ